MKPPLPRTRTGGDDEAPAAALVDRAHVVIAGRYALTHRLGAGGHGEVWAADDAVTGQRVAVKLLRDTTRSKDSPRARREVAALRLLRVPGVVELLDEGVDALGAWVVMELLEGTPFPGRPTPCAWRDLAATTEALLETLGRIHAAGVVHRDLKPGNVLVDAEGHPSVLDFGVALAPLEADGDRPGELVGTPAYLSPEQVAGEPVGPGADLYALGVMLYEALAGVGPFENDRAMAIMYARVFREPRPLREVAPAVPLAVAEAVDQLLRRHADARPRSAADVARLLRGGRAARELSGIARVELPRLGGSGPVDALVAAARERRPALLVGDAGTGRSRCLAEAVAALEARAIDCVRVGRASTPFAALEPALGELDLPESSGLDDVVRAVDARLHALLVTGAVVVADDADELDPWSAGALARAASWGAVLRAQRSPTREEHVEVIALGPLPPRALEALFAGHERVLHLPSDAARAMWSRTGGVAARVAAEAAAWVRAGVARWSGAALVVDRRSLDALSLGGVAPRHTSLRPAGLSLTGAGTRLPALPAQLLDLLAWITLAAPSATATVLARATQQPLWRVDALLGQLADARVARRTEVGTWEPVAPRALEHLWPAARRRAAHEALAGAFPPGTEGRLVHLVAAACLDDPDDARDDAALATALAREATALARRRAAEGMVGSATAALAEGMFAARRLELPSDAPEAWQLLATWVELALAERTPHALDRVHYELSRGAARPEAFDPLAALVRAATSARGQGDRALALADAVPPFDDAGLELCRVTVRMSAARRCALETEAAALDDAEAAARARGDDRWAVRVAVWRGRFVLRQGRPLEAARLLDACAARADDVLDRLGAVSAAAAAWLAADRPSEALDRARELRESAARRRHVYYECLGEHLVRAAAWRAGAALQVDAELADLAAAVGVRELEADVCLLEAAVARRCGDATLAHDLAARAHEHAAAVGAHEQAALARALALTSAGDVDDDVMADVLRACGDRDATTALQVLAMLAAARPDARDALRAMGSSRGPAPDDDRTLEVLTGLEIREHLGVPSK